MSTIACPHCNGAITIQAVAVAGHAPAAPRPSDLGVCPDHRTPWEFKSGISKKTGQAYAFWSCNGRDANGDYCRRKPDARWTPPPPPAVSAPRDDDPMPF